MLLFDDAFVQQTFENQLCPSLTPLDRSPLLFFLQDVLINPIIHHLPDHDAAEVKQMFTRVSFCTNWALRGVNLTFPPLPFRLFCVHICYIVLDDAKVLIKVNTSNNFVNFFFHVEQLPLKQRITELVLKHLEKAYGSDREFATAANISHPLIGKFRTGSAMNLDTLEKIVNANPEILPEIAKLFSSKTEQKHTDETLIDEPAVSEAERHQHLEDLRSEIKHLRRVNNVQAEAILNFSRKLGIPEQG